MSQLNDGQILRAVSALADGGAGMEFKLRLLAEQRALSPDASRIDRVLVTGLTEWRQRFEEVRAAQEELGKLVENLTSPPLREGVYCGSTVVSGVPLAVVACEQARRLVRPGPEITLDDLLPGDRVILTESGGAILDLGDSTDAQGAVGTVERLSVRDRLIVRHHGEEVVVTRAAVLCDMEIRPGDQVLWDPVSRFAFELMPATDDARWMLRDLPDVGREVLAGLGTVPDRITARFVLGVAHPELAELYEIDGTRSLLLWGPPGCGKTTMMRVIASALGRAAGERCRVAIVNGADLESPWVGETQSNVRALFRQLGEGDGPRLLFIDEVEAIGRTRGSISGHHSDKFLSSWLAALDGLRGHRNLAIVAASNRKDLIDPALLERLSSMELFVPRPTMAAAREIFRVHLSEKIPVHPNGAASAAARTSLIDSAVLALYAPNAPGTEVARLRFRDNRERVVMAKDLMSGRLIQQICRSARETAFGRHAAGGDAGVRLEDIEQAASDALDRLCTLLTPRNARSHLTDIPDDMDVIAVEPGRRRVRPAGFAVPMAEAARA